MYLDHFGLDAKPFSITPEPRFLHLSERYREALAHLLYGAGEAGGFLQLTGEVGTGKTMICRAFLAQLPEAVDAALVLNPKLTAPELLCNILEELRIPLPDERDSTKALIDRLNAHLLDAYSRGRRTVLLIDEAQNLSPDVLEQVRLLTNLETDRHKLLQIFLIGQPELRHLLDQPELRQVAQRITARCHLMPLSPEETRAYVAHRLQVAGARRSLFTRGALKEIYAFSGGIPRLINTVCDRALLGAYATDCERVERRVVRRAAAELTGSRDRQRPFGARAALLGVLALALAGAGFLPDTRSALTLLFERMTPPVIATAAEPPAPLQPDALPAHIRIQQLVREAPASLDAGAAGAGLLENWGIVASEPVADFCQNVRTHGLRCLRGRASWKELRRLNRPAVLNFWSDDGVRHVLLTGMQDQRAEFRVGDAQWTLPLTESDEFWRGNYLILWRPPDSEASLIGRRSSPWAVQWLWERLGGGVPVPESYTDTLREKVVDFQQQHALKTDGIAGPRTLIQLNTAAADPTIPRLDVRVGGK
ncbi:ExeA family protein [Thiohalomonas denitrificans]|uniref:General secretion pathway protein A n=1 Tax=Thiohalomonas denitrificans TaxID=415747 RepID=A0A1G5QKK3_9GAMM|nr:ExeA family protein [Thiohalomonas denitrificans]SCZ62080.1 general secretion pathway protein A [Thiohalomonas denitrificans]